MVEPGSTFKIVVVSGALNDRLVQLNDAFDCEHGHFPFAGRVLHDHESYGAAVGRKHHHQVLQHRRRQDRHQDGRAPAVRLHPEFGFGERTGLPLPGEVRGIVHPVKKWSKVSIAQIPMGQGIAVTRLQMMMAMCAIANKGVLMRPMLVDRLEDRDGHVVAQYSPQRVRQVISESAARADGESAQDRGLARRHRAQGGAGRITPWPARPARRRKSEGGGYLHGKYFSSFIGFFPADNPELCISVVLDEPKEGYYGGAVAGPIFKQIAERAANYLNIRPDIGGPTPPEAVAQTESRPVKTIAQSQ